MLEMKSNRIKAEGKTKTQNVAEVGRWSLKVLLADNLRFLERLVIMEKRVP